MLVLAKLVFMAVALFMFINLFLSDFEDKKNAISYKIYLFLFVFVLNFMFHIFGNLINNKKISMVELIESSINNSLLAVIAYGVYGDLINDGFYKDYSHSQKTMILILLIIGFIATIKILELLISSN
jgi:hypothetical protein